ncbi:MAG: T9SS type A sorting domain-containing protein [Sporocytophaga sp.]|uniref:T9SS type A sorting domain-containing protein n=1 Tax=Sporocytophaga sp. TaxID=2231183 RepID=UPI001B1269B3|nr:T9SS type A sorting domain-containing protein [Sporocytophaga sp.]MBO9701925.1 T9SS type A sorting domain-containing protein [Sporocytophaga sp.]
MKKVLIWSLMLLAVLLHSNTSFSQCGSQTATIVNQCPNQSPQLSIPTVVPGTDYIWTVGGSKYGQGYDFTYQAPLTTPTVISYQEQINQTGGPLKGATSPYTMPASGTTVLNSAYTVSVSSTTAFKLNAFTVPIKLYYCDPNTTYRLKVIVGPTASPTAASVWYNFKCADLINTTESQTYLVPIKINTSPTDPGLTIPAGSTTISVIYNDGPNPTGVSDISGLVAFPTTSFNNSYTLGTTTVTHSSTTNRPAFLDWDITTLCPTVNVPVSPTASPSCCVPGNVIMPDITTNTGTNVIDSDPVSPAITLTTPLQTGYYYQWFKNGQAISSAQQNDNDLSVTTGGQYTVRVVEKLADINKTSCYKSDVETVSKRVLFAQTDKNTLCLGEIAKLNALGATGNTAGSIVWSGAPGISDINAKTPTFLPTSTGTFILVLDAEVPVGNQVINGDFELYKVGDASPGFTYSSYYNFKDPKDAVVSPSQTFFGVPDRKGISWLQNGTFSLYNYVLSNNDGYTGIKPCPDHTTGKGNLYFTDAASKNVPAGTALTDSYMWSQQVTLVAGQEYEFAAWFTNANSEYCDCTDPFDNTIYAIKDPANPTAGQPKINFYVNDALVNPTPITIDGETCKWQKVSYKYTATTSGTATIKISEISRADAGNDFAMDDISFGAPGRQKHKISIDVTDCDDLNATTLCTSGELTLEATSSNGFFSKWTHTDIGGVTSTTTIDKPNDATTTAEPVTTTDKYSAEFKFVRGNQISNPDYSLTTKNGSNMTDRTNLPGTYGLNNGEYIIGKDPSTYSNTQDKIYISVPDHTTGSTSSFDYFSGSGNYSAGHDVVFSQSIAVTNGEEYGFSVWLANIQKEFTKTNPDTSNTGTSAAKTTKLDLYVGGVPVKRLVLPLNTSWNNFGYSFIAAISGNITVELRVPNLNLQKAAAFAMDDIQIGKVDTKIKDVTPDPNCTLPVTYLYANVERSGSQINVKWATAQEKDADQFIIEKSKDGITFYTTGIVKAKGNSTSVCQYSYSEAISGEYPYYRIKQTDLDGKFEYSKIFFVSDIAKDAIIVYPNPSTTSFTIKANTQEGESLLIKIIDTKGSEIANLTHQGNETIVVGSDLLPGVYILEVFGEYQVWRKRIVKQ